MVTAIILAGGLGTRLRSVVDDRPKIMATVNGRPFITCLFDQLLLGKISEAVLCTGYMAEMVSDALGDCYHSMRLIYSKEEEPLGTGGALRLALEKTSADLVIAMNGDSYCPFDITQLINDHVCHRASCSMVVTPIEDVSRYGTVALAADGSVTSFLEKGVASGAGYINAGIYLFKPEVLKSVPLGVQISLEREIFPSLIGAGLYGHISQGPFIDIGIPEDYQQAGAFFAGLQT